MKKSKVVQEIRVLATRTAAAKSRFFRYLKNWLSGPTGRETNVKYDQLIQAARDVVHVLELAKKTDPRISKRREDIQRAGALWYLSRRRGLGVTLHHVYLLYGAKPFSTMDAANQIRKAVEAGARKWRTRARTEDPGGPAGE